MMLALNGASAAIIKAKLPDGGAAFTAQTAIAAVLGIVASLVAYQSLWLKVGLTNDLPSSQAHGNGKALLGPDTGI